MRTNDTDVQSWNAQTYAQHAAFVPELGQPLVGLLGLPPGARVLDLGCGDGTLTEKLQERGYRVLGVDASAAMVQATRARGLDAEVADGHDLPFSEPAFDAVFSNAALHWLKRPEAALAGIHRALRPGGVFVAELGGAGNVQRVRAALWAELAARGRSGQAADPWYFPTLGQYASKLEQAGFGIERMETFARPTPLGGDVLAWLALFGQSFVAALPADERSAYLRDVRARLAPELCDEAGQWVLDYVRLRVRAHKSVA
ncbi:MAG: trans-aconitate methyltransferase [Myxococcaceae bacterium]|nr:trans-aconitate methyltransferase [Myxococcaceae bacterium]